MKWMKRHQPIRTVASLLWFFAVTSPAWALWAVSLGGVSLDLRFSNIDPLCRVPGWTKNELTYFIPVWRPF